MTVVLREMRIVSLISRGHSFYILLKGIKYDNVWSILNMRQEFLPMFIKCLLDIFSFFLNVFVLCNLLKKFRKCKLVEY